MLLALDIVASAVAIYLAGYCFNAANMNAMLRLVGRSRYRRAVFRHAVLCLVFLAIVLGAVWL
jgi:hypothetical protein